MMRSNMEMSEAEFIALLTLAEKIADRLIARAYAESDHVAYVPPAQERRSAPVQEQASAPAQDVDDVTETADEAEVQNLKRIEDGTRAWAPLVRTWAQNFEVEEAPQPDRAGALMAVFCGYSRSILAYIRERGGLAGACIDTLARENIVAPDEASSLGKRIALNIVQVGTAIGLPTDHWIERSLLSREDPDKLPLGGGLLGDVVDMTRPEYKA